MTITPGILHGCTTPELAKTLTPGQVRALKTLHDQAEWGLREYDGHAGYFPRRGQVWCARKLVALGFAEYEHLCVNPDDGDDETKLGVVLRHGQLERTKAVLRAIDPALVVDEDSERVG